MINDPERLKQIKERHKQNMSGDFAQEDEDIGWLIEKLEQSEKYIREMVDKAAEKHLSGYRELGQKCASLERALDTIKWRDIGTAPKDGTSILVWCIESAVPYEPDKLMWMFDIAKWVGRSTTDPVGFFNCRRGRNPTHWIPLPESPGEVVTVNNDYLRERR